MATVSFSALEAIVQEARIRPSDNTQRQAVKAVLNFATAPNPKQRVKASAQLPLLYETCTAYQSKIHDTIFDLCEDTLEEVRIAGYNALVDLSSLITTVRRKNADVLCQLLQIENQYERLALQACLSKHIRICPAITYSIFAEYLIAYREGRPNRGPLLAAVLSFLNGGGGGHSQSTSPSFEASTHQRDEQGGRSAVIDVSWRQKGRDADEVLRKPLHMALQFASAEEGKTITSILCILQNECVTLAPESASLLNILIKRTEEALGDNSSDDFASWAKLCTLMVSPIEPPASGLVLASNLPRSDPAILLAAFQQWTSSERWQQYRVDTQREITVMIGMAVKASQDVLADQRRPGLFAIGSPYATAAEQILGSCDHVLQSWIEHDAYSGSREASVAVRQIITTFSDKQEHTNWRLNFGQSTRLQQMRRCASKFTAQSRLPHFRELCQAVDIALLLSKENSLRDASLSNNPVPYSIPRQAETATQEDQAPRKRTRNELEGKEDSMSSPIRKEEPVPKKPRLGPLEALSGRDRQVSSRNVALHTPPINFQTPQPRVASELALTIGNLPSPGLSIKGAAGSYAGKPESIPQTPRKSESEKAPKVNTLSSNNPATRLVIRDAYRNSAPTSSVAKEFPSEPQDIQASVQRLLLGNRTAAPATPATIMPEPIAPSSSSRPSLLERMKRSDGDTSQATSNATRAPSILDRIDISNDNRQRNHGKKHFKP